ncbi:MAG TPA: hypothetical protein DCZ69_13960 [Syntrophobacteraceae bacterium]|nr:hypothetical protein [Syntrophobacteraceae bacterium]
MKATKGFFSALGVTDDDSVLQSLVSQTGIPVERLRYYNSTNTAPSGHDLDRICIVANLSPAELFLHMGILDERVLYALRLHAEKVFQIICEDLGDPWPVEGLPKLVFSTDLGRLYQGDCLQLMPHMESDSIDVIFAQPPADLEKLFPDLADSERQANYVMWCETWLQECIRLLKPGGSLFLANEPGLNVLVARYLNHRLVLRHWIAIETERGAAQSGHLQSSHHAVLYYCKGDRPRTFHPERLPREMCPMCKKERYGVSSRGESRRRRKGDIPVIRLSDLWIDITPPTDARQKKAIIGKAPSLKLLDRILELSTDEGDTVFDPFSGTGTSLIVAEVKKRRWVGIVLEAVNEVKERFGNMTMEAALIESFRTERQLLLNWFTLASIADRRR